MPILPPNAGDNKTEFVVLCCSTDVADARPKLVHTDVEFVDCDHEITKQAVRYLPDPPRDVSRPTLAPPAQRAHSRR